jgi:cysteine desulfurase
MLANNETGMIFPIPQIAAICRRKGTLLHTDAVQAAGRIPLNVDELGVDLLSLSAHKLYAPKGVGMIYVRHHTPFWPHIIGGGQEKSRRGGTENVAGIVGFGRAAELAIRQMQYGNAEICGLRDRMESSLLCGIPHAFLNGAPEPRLPNTSNIAFEGIEAEAVLIGLDQAGICASSGSACTTGSLSPSHVLKAMGLSPELSRGSLRFSLGRQTTPADVSALQSCLPPLIEKLRSMSANSK